MLQETSQTHVEIFRKIDPFVHLTALMIKCSGGGNDLTTKLDLLKKVRLIFVIEFDLIVILTLV